MREEGLRVDYERLPGTLGVFSHRLNAALTYTIYVTVTDEQAPIPGVYSRIEERVYQALKRDSSDVGFVFNCQMGRGRTTTGM